MDEAVRRHVGGSPSRGPPPTGLTLLDFAAGSMNRAFTFGYTMVNNQPVSQIDLMQIGVVDRQPTPLPAFTGEYETAYLDLSASATDNNPGGVRTCTIRPAFLEYDSARRRRNSGARRIPGHHLAIREESSSTPS